MMLDGLNAQCRGDMGLAGARTADQHDIVGAVDKVAAVKLPDQRLIDLAAGKVEAGEIAIGREPDRKSVVEGKSVSVRVDLGGRRTLKKNNSKYKSEKH